MADDTRTDLLTNLIRAMQDLQPSFSDEAALRLEEQMRNEFGGSRGYILKRCNTSGKIREKFNGRNAARVANDVGVHRATVYRRLKA